MSKSIQGRSNAIDRASVIDGAFDTLSNKPNASTPLPNEPKAPSPRTRSRAKGAFTLRRNRPGAPTTTLYQAKGAPHSLRSKAKAHSTRCRTSRSRLRPVRGAEPKAHSPRCGTGQVRQRPRSTRPKAHLTRCGARQRRIRHAVEQAERRGPAHRVNEPPSGNVAAVGRRAVVRRIPRRVRVPRIPRRVRVPRMTAAVSASARSRVPAAARPPGPGRPRPGRGGASPAAPARRTDPRTPRQLASLAKPVLGQAGVTSSSACGTRRSSLPVSVLGARSGTRSPPASWTSAPGAGPGADLAGVAFACGRVPDDDREQALAPLGVGDAQHGGLWLQWRRRHQARSRWFHQRTRLARNYAQVS